MERSCKPSRSKKTCTVSSRRALQGCISLCILAEVSAQVCSRQAKVSGRDSLSGDHFGESISISGDTVLTTAPNHDLDVNSTNAGAAYVFTRSGNDWYEEAKLVSNTSDKDHYFGRSVSISGDYAIIGDRAFDGAAHIYIRQRTTGRGPDWFVQQKLRPADARGGDEFGRAVGVSGSVAIVGAPNGQKAMNFAGAAYIFVRSGTHWTEEAKLYGSAAGHYFGDLVAISGDTAVVGTSPVEFGSVYVFVHSGQSWNQQTRIDSPKGIASGDEFGSSLDLYHNSIVIGAPNSDEGGTASGAVYVFYRATSQWKQQAVLVADDRVIGLRFGRAVSIYDGMIAVAAEGGRDKSGNFLGSVYMFSRIGDTWITQGKVVEASTKFGDRFGNSIAISGKYLAAGAPRRKYQGGAASGVVYLMKCTTTTSTATTTYSAQPYPSWMLGAGLYTTSALNTRAVTSFSARIAYYPAFPFALVSLIICLAYHE